MRRLVLGILLATFVACGGDSSTSPSKVTAVQFRLDANTCGPIFGSQSLTFTFFVDGVQIGTASLGINITSPPFSVITGSHVASASVTNTTIRWQNLSFSVASGQTFTYILLC